MSDELVVDLRIHVSWDGSGAFTGPHDDVTPDTAAEPGFAVDEGRDAARTLAPPKIAAGAFELWNDDGTYSQHRADSPLYQRVLPGRPVRYSARIGAEGAYDEARPYDEPDYYDGRATWDLGQHLIDEIAQSTAWGNRRVQISTLGWEVVLTDSIITTPLYRNIRTDVAAALVLDACSWPADKRSIAVSDSTLLYWWADAQRPFDALLALLGAEGPGTFYVSRDGVFHWEGRNYRAITPRATTSQATYRATSSPGGLWATAIGYDPGYAQIYNSATYAVRRRAPVPGSPAWSYGAPLTLAPYERRVLIAKPSVPFEDAAVITVGLDYTVTSGAASVAFASATGIVAEIEVLAGAAGATIEGPTASPTQGLGFRASLLEVVSETIVKNAIDASASIALYSPIPGRNVPIPLAVTGWPEIAAIAAQGVCDAWISRYQEPRPTVTLALRAVDRAHAEQVITRMVSDRVTVVEPNTGLDSDIWINALKLRVSGPGGRIVEADCAGETCDKLSGALWDTSRWDDPAAVWGV